MRSQAGNNGGKMPGEAAAKRKKKTGNVGAAAPENKDQAVWEPPEAKELKEKGGIHITSDDGSVDVYLWFEKDGVKGAVKQTQESRNIAHSIMLCAKQETDNGGVSEDTIKLCAKKIATQKGLSIS